MEDVPKLIRVSQFEHFISEDKPLGTAFKILFKESYRDITLVDHMKGIENVVESQFDSSEDKLVVCCYALCISRASVHELARSVGGLPGMRLYMFDKMSCVRICELLECHRILSLTRKIEKRLRKGELVGCGVAPEENHTSEIGLFGRPGS
mgnify:CR=1 FL=1